MVLRHCVKSARIRIYSGPYFTAFGLNTGDRRISSYSVRMQENRDQNNSEYGHFLHTLSYSQNNFGKSLWQKTNLVFKFYLLFFFLSGIRILVTLLLDTLPMLGNVFLLCVLILMVFAIIGVQLWQGILRNRCFLDLPSNASLYLNNHTRYVSRFGMF